MSLKHEKFAAALVNKQRQIDLRDILTITCEKDAFRKCLIEALNMYGPSYHGYSTIDEYEADIILNVLSLRRDNLGVIDGVMSPLPFLIEFSETAWVKSIAAPQLGSMDFLLHSLRYNFPKDYERHQQTRESSMQRAVRRILDDAIPGLTYRDNIRIRRDGRTITDIDFMAAEEASGTIILFQLKHQDHYRADMRKRSSRAKHLKEKCASWLAAVREWLSLSSHKELRSAVQLKSGFVPRRICIVLLTRHFAHFLGTLDLQTDAVYATWMQFYDALNRIGVEGRERSLLSLFEVLQAFMTHKMDPGHKVEIDDYYHLSGLSYRIRPRGASVES